MCLNGRVEKIGAHLQVLICEKESEERAKRELLDRGGKRTPSVLILPPTTKRCGSEIELLITLRNVHWGDLILLQFSFEELSVAGKIIKKFFSESHPALDTAGESSLSLKCENQYLYLQ